MKQRRTSDFSQRVVVALTLKSLQQPRWSDFTGQPVQPGQRKHQLEHKNQASGNLCLEAPLFQWVLDTK